jgi:hypothetical protein
LYFSKRNFHEPDFYTCLVKYTHQNHRPSHRAYPFTISSHAFDRKTNHTTPTTGMNIASFNRREMIMHIMVKIISKIRVRKEVTTDT